MKTSTILFASLLLTAAFAPSNGAVHGQTYDRGDYDIFYDELRPYGEWMRGYDGVLVWRPHGVHRHWRPYSEGRWAWTDHGWYWVSYEPFGWAVFHYGRWSYDWRLGWVWLPDHVWGPAWVEWRYSDAYVGWAPLPPHAIFHVSFGIRFSRPWNAPVHSWNFVEYRRFGSTVRYRDLVASDRVQRVIGTTRRGSGYTVDRDRVVNRGIDRDFVQQRSGNRFERHEVTSTERREDRYREGVIESYRPQRGTQRQEFRNDQQRQIDSRSGERMNRPSSPSHGNDSRRVTPAPSRERTPSARPSPQQSRPRERSTSPSRSKRNRDH